MKKFDVYHHPTLGYAAVKQGFSWPGFFFTGFWALSKRMWVGGSVLLVAVLLIGAAISDAGEAGDTTTYVVLSLIQFLIWLATGTRGNERWAASLRRRGFTLAETIDADEPDGAIAACVHKKGSV